MTRHRIISHHWLRRTARAYERDLIALQAKARAGSLDATAELHAAGVGIYDRLRVERAGRIRARWVVATGEP